jgi:hypothetical protein
VYQYQLFGFGPLKKLYFMKGLRLSVGVGLKICYFLAGWSALAIPLLMSPIDDF